MQAGTFMCWLSFKPLWEDEPSYIYCLEDNDPKVDTVGTAIMLVVHKSSCTLPKNAIHSD